MKNVLLLGAGGVAGIGMTRCLKNDFIVYGQDDSDWARDAMEAKEPLWEETDLYIPIPDSLVLKYKRVFKDKTLLPSLEEIELCQDKARCARALGDLAPKTYWIRDTKGAGGAGAQMSSEYLPGRNFSCELAYLNGEFIGYFMKERLSYSVKNTDMPLDKRGSSAVSQCVVNMEVFKRSIRAIDKISLSPHGVYAIDFKENEEGEPLITEINPGRFLTASYTYFYSTGYNLPLKLYKAYFGEEYSLALYPKGTMVIRQVDSLPKIIRP